MSNTAQALSTIFCSDGSCVSLTLTPDASPSRIIADSAAPSTARMAGSSAGTARSVRVARTSTGCWKRAARRPGKRTGGAAAVDARVVDAREQRAGRRRRRVFFRGTAEEKAGMVAGTSFLRTSVILALMTRCSEGTVPISE